MGFGNKNGFGGYDEKKEEIRFTGDGFGGGRQKKLIEVAYIGGSTYNPSPATNNIETIFHRETGALGGSGTYLQQDVRDRLNETFDNGRPKRKKVA